MGQLATGHAGAHGVILYKYWSTKENICNWQSSLSHFSLTSHKWIPDVSSRELVESYIFPARNQLICGFYSVLKMLWVIVTNWHALRKVTTSYLFWEFSRTGTKVDCRIRRCAVNRHSVAWYCRNNTGTRPPERQRLQHKWTLINIQPLT